VDFYFPRELRLIEAMTAACRALVDYQIHPKRPGSLRYSKDPNPTIKAFKEMKYERYEKHERHDRRSRRK
jgi:hypothetical protein